MKRPTELRVLGKPFAIVWCEEGAMDLSDYGHMNLRKQEIAIRADLKPALERDTLIHEVLHAIEKQLGLDLAEVQVNQLACGLSQVFADNFELLAYLANGTDTTPKQAKR